MLLVAGCGSDGLTSSDDMASGADMIVRVDLAGATCNDIDQAEQTYLDRHRNCVRDSDCAEVTTPCGTPYACGISLEASAVGGLATFDNAWAAMGCSGPCPPCKISATVFCDNGTCSFLPLNSRPIGAPCGSDTECVGNGSLPGVCLQAPTFPAGECSADCGTNGACPSGALCRPNLAFPNHELECFPACGGDSDCRQAEGYKCCPSWVSSSPGMVCYPGPCP